MADAMLPCDYVDMVVNKLKTYELPKELSIASFQWPMCLSSLTALDKWADPDLRERLVLENLAGVLAHFPTVSKLLSGPNVDRLGLSKQLFDEFELKGDEVTNFKMLERKLLARDDYADVVGTDAMDRVGKIIAARASERRALDPKVATTVYSTGGSGGGRS